jgi:ornithine cyclodeaminase/alanine dehydrogenase-like protein (mu-crystallin family)
MHQRTNGPDHEPANVVNGITERLLTGDRLAAALLDVPTPWLAPALTALAARHLLVPREITASIIGTGPAVGAQLSAISRAVPGISHVAVLARDGVRPDRQVVDHCHAAGIGLSTAATRCEALFGANLVVITAPDRDRRSAPLPRGTVLVNASGEPLPSGLTAAAQRVVVDDHALLPAGSPLVADADLRQVVTGERPGRTDVDQVLLVELLVAGSVPHPRKETM